MDTIQLESFLTHPLRGENNHGIASFNIYLSRNRILYDREGTDLGIFWCNYCSIFFFDFVIATKRHCIGVGFRTDSEIEYDIFVWLLNGIPRVVFDFYCPKII